MHAVPYITVNPWALSPAGNASGNEHCAFYPDRFASRPFTSSLNRSSMYSPLEPLTADERLNELEAIQREHEYRMGGTCVDVVRDPAAWQHGSSPANTLHLTHNRANPVHLSQQHAQPCCVPSPGIDKAFQTLQFAFPPHNVSEVKNSRSHTSAATITQPITIDSSNGYLNRPNKAHAQGDAIVPGTPTASGACTPPHSPFSHCPVLSTPQNSPVSSISDCSTYDDMDDLDGLCGLPSLTSGTIESLLADSDSSFPCFLDPSALLLLENESCEVLVKLSPNFDPELKMGAPPRLSSPVQLLSDSDDEFDRLPAPTVSSAPSADSANRLPTQGPRSPAGSGGNKEHPASPQECAAQASCAQSSSTGDVDAEVPPMAMAPPSPTSRPISRFIQLATPPLSPARPRSPVATIPSRPTTNTSPNAPQHTSPAPPAQASDATATGPAKVPEPAPAPPPRTSNRRRVPSAALRRAGSELSLNTQVSCRDRDAEAQEEEEDADNSRRHKRQRVMDASPPASDADSGSGCSESEAEEAEGFEVVSGGEDGGSSDCSQQGVAKSTKRGYKRRRGSPRKPQDVVCRSCGATSTPQWRCGPQGPRTLCNACGVRYKKGLPLRDCQEQPQQTAPQVEQVVPAVSGGPRKRGRRAGA